jgi:RNA polymerase sigma factor (sigma-70 family)
LCRAGPWPRKSSRTRGWECCEASAVSRDAPHFGPGSFASWSTGRGPPAPGTGAEAAVDASRFDAAGAWTAPPEQWIEDIDDRLRAGKLAGRIRLAIEELPARQREVVTLRDLEGLTSDEVCEVLEISDGNQRVLLHRGRSRVRQVLETEFGRA